MRLKYNAPISLSFAVAATLVLAISQLTGGALIQNWFTLWPDFRASSFQSWFRLFSYVLGHADWTHLVSNLMLLLLIGPVLEEKYGPLAILAMMAVTAATTGVVSILFVRAGLLGASGIVFMLILLSSFTNIRAGEIPLTFLAVVALYLVREFVAALTPNMVSQLAHIAGGLVGAGFGFLFARKERPPKIGPPQGIPTEPPATASRKGGMT